MNKKRGLTDTISSPVMEIPGHQTSGANEKRQLNHGRPSNRQEAPAPTIALSC